MMWWWTCYCFCIVYHSFHCYEVDAESTAVIPKIQTGTNAAVDVIKTSLANHYSKTLNAENERTTTPTVASQKESLAADQKNKTLVDINNKTVEVDQKNPSNISNIDILNKVSASSTIRPVPPLQSNEIVNDKKDMVLPPITANPGPPITRNPGQSISESVNSEPLNKVNTLLNTSNEQDPDFYEDSKDYEDLQKNTKDVSSDKKTKPISKTTAAFTPLQENDDDDDEGPIWVDKTTDEKSVDKPLKKVQGNPIFNGDAVDDKSSHFFAYFLTLMVMTVFFYLLFHNKQKIIALIIEGRGGKGQRRNSSSRARYHKLDNNLEEAMSSTHADFGSRVN